LNEGFFILVERESSGIKMEIVIEKIVHGGYGLGRKNNKIVLVPFSVPGDILDIECTLPENISEVVVKDDRARRSCTPEAPMPRAPMSFGWIKEIVKPSPHRVRSECPVFGICGGCDFDNMEYDFELEVKRAVLTEDLQRIAKISEVAIEKTIKSEKEYGYRNHAKFKVDTQGALGFFMKKSHEVVPLPEKGCLLLNSSINKYVNELRGSIVFEKGGFRIRSNVQGKIFQKGIPGREGDRYCFHYVSGLTFRTGIDDFFQVNTRVLDKWVKLISNYLEPEKNDRVIELYCGSGLISLSLAPMVKSITGIELNRSAVKNADYNARLNGINNVSFLKADAARGLDASVAADKIIVDPPRTGLTQEAIRKIVSLRPVLIVYASCDTATFSRDVHLLKRSGYLLEKVSFIDMFPKTCHSEVIARIVS